MLAAVTDKGNSATAMAISLFASCLLTYKTYIDEPTFLLLQEFFFFFWVTLSQSSYFLECVVQAITLPLPAAGAGGLLTLEPYWPLKSTFKMVFCCVPTSKGVLERRLGPSLHLLVLCECLPDACLSYFGEIICWQDLSRKSIPPPSDEMLHTRGG